MFLFVLGFGLGFYVCYLTFKIKQTKKEKKTDAKSSVNKVSDNISKVENNKK